MNVAKSLIAICTISFVVFVFAKCAPAQIPPYAQAPEGRFRTVESIGLIDDFAVNDFLQDGEKVYVKGEGAFIWAANDLATPIDNKTVFSAGPIGGRFFREPVGEALQFTTAERTALRYAVGKTYMIHDTDQQKLYMAIGTGAATPPTYVDVTGAGGGGGGNIIDDNLTSTTGSKSHDFSGTQQTWNNFSGLFLNPPNGQQANIVLGENPANGNQKLYLYAPASLESDVNIEFPYELPPIGNTYMLTIESQASGPALMYWAPMDSGSTVNLSFNPDPNFVTIDNDAGSGATILPADATNAGVILPGEKAQIAEHQSIFGFPAGATTLGAFPGDLLPTNSTVYTAFATLEADAEAKQTLLGVAASSIDLGTFTGATISDNVDIKTALQELETKAEAPVSGAWTVDDRTWTVVGSTGTITLSQTPADPEKVLFHMWSGLTFLSTDGGVGYVQITGTTATVDADDYGINDGERCVVTYEAQ